jgi:hypothetical protein
MRFKPTVEQLCTIADMTVARMTPDLMANRIGVSADDFGAWRLRMVAAAHAEEASYRPPRLPMPPERGARMTAEGVFELPEQA